MTPTTPTRNRIAGALSNKRGASMLFALILLVVFLTLGVTVMIAASGGSTNVSQRTASRQAYFAARSASQVIDSMMKGTLGNAVRDNYITYKTPQDCTIALSAGAASGVSFEDVRLTVKNDTLAESVGPHVPGTSGEPYTVTTTYTLTIGSESTEGAVIELTAKYNESSYRIKLNYYCVAYYTSMQSYKADDTPDGVPIVTNWTFSSPWKLAGVSQ